MYIRQHIQDIKPMKGAAFLLSKLHEHGLKIAIATSSYADIYKEKMKYHPDIEKWIDLVVTGEEVQNGKPAPDIFLLAASRL